MIKHIVMWKLKPEFHDKHKYENAIKIQKQIEGLTEFIPEIIEIELGIDFNKSERAFDIVLYSIFENKADLKIYQNHIEHIKVKQLINSLTSDVTVVDYEV